MRSTLIATIGLALIAGACTNASMEARGGSTPTSDPGTTVAIEGFLFRPAEIEVTAGTSITWENGDEILHTVTAGTPDEPGTSFDGQLADVGATFSFTFDEPGTFAYYCTRHHHMQGTVRVT